LQGQPTSRKKLIDSNKQLRDSNATLTAKVKSLEKQIAALQALLPEYDLCCCCMAKWSMSDEIVSERIWVSMHAWTKQDMLTE